MRKRGTPVPLFPTFPTFGLTGHWLENTIDALVLKLTVMSQNQSGRDPYLSTGQVAEILGVTKKTIKNWLKVQLIPEPERNPINRYRRWTLQDIETIRRILHNRNEVK